MRATIAHNSCIEKENDIVVNPPRQQECLYENDAGTRPPEDIVTDVVALPNLTNYIAHLLFNTTAACHSHIGSKEGNYDSDDSADSGGELPDANSIPCQTARAESDEEYNSCQENTGNDVCSLFCSSPPAAGDECSRLVTADNNAFLSALTTDKSINLSLVNQLKTQVVSKSKVLTLFKMKQTIQENMSVSGTYNHVVWDFVEGALQKRGSSSVTKIALYYFFMRCEQIPDINAHFQPFMDTCMIGATNAPLWNEDIGGAGTSQSVVSVLS